LQKGKLLAALGRLRESLVPLRRAARLDLDDRIAVEIALYQLSHRRHQAK
jgi:hypothetical protein